MPETNRLPIVERYIDQQLVTAYSHASGDHNPIHLDLEFASSSQFGQIVAHGMLTLAFVSQMLVLEFGCHWLETGGLKIRFKGPAYLGDTVVTRGHVVRQQERDGLWQVDCRVGLDNQNGNELISGTASVWLPYSVLESVENAGVES